MDLLTGVIIGVLLWIFTGVAEKVYVLSKHYRRAQMNARLVNALSKLSQTHHGYHKGTGPCVCKQHTDAILTLRAWHELGGKLK